MLVLTIIVFIIVLSILVLVHEFGHFIVAKKFGIRVEEFGFGLPPRIFGKKYGETVYSLNLLPIGGFVKLYGEEGEVTGEDKDRSFTGKSKVARTLVIVAGVVMNFILAILIISFIFTQGVLVPTNRIHIEGVSQDSPAKKAGLLPGDVIWEMANDKEKKAIKNSEDLISFTNKNLGKELRLTLFRCAQGKPQGENISCKTGFGQEELTISLIPRKESPKGEGAMGVVISNLEEKRYSIIEAPIKGTLEVIQLSSLMFVAVIQLFWRLLTMAQFPQDVAGPVGVAQITGQALKFGPMAILQLLGFLSLNLAVVNILPIPALDGGRLLFIGIEAIFGKKVLPKVEQTAHQIGMIVLLALILLITLNDVKRLFSSSSLGSMLKNFAP